MFSYRHAYHAGNYADVFKHLCQMMIINKLKEKQKPFVYMDSHSGAGLYQLDSDMASKNKEFRAGVDRLVDKAADNPELLAYLQLVNEFRVDNQYPGSPAIAAHLLRAQDRLCLMEWHNNEFANLQRYLYRDKRVACHHRDGYEGLVALTPPDPARGLILIDPPYELAEDYQKVVQVISKIQQRWPTGIIALWYPLLASQRDKSQPMIEALHATQPINLYVAEVWVKQQQQELGMHGSGMAFINLPWQLDGKIEACLPLLAEAMEEPGQGGFRSHWLIEAK
ncbi:23S rRNA (adenine(2030)-N(6))-methyltransferase RlmJ [Neptunicella sp. SCSIO 80796]|uniref:23S rRNA (adenine(2030)-N(6))-methyltransferase RlmJ n=1 Tax=Neptunicella plasticusilytica TaxID=3117012 RepID=UPI003A4D238C